MQQQRDASWGVSRHPVVLLTIATAAAAAATTTAAAALCFERCCLENVCADLCCQLSHVLIQSTTLCVCVYVC